MAMARSRLAAIVLAAGAGSRFSDEPGAKLLAGIHGRPVLQHVLDAVRAFAPGQTVVVLGHGADAIERSIAWSGERRVINAAPDRGLASSIQVGLAALNASDTEGVFIVLGDQPRLRSDVMEALADEDESAARPIVAPRYAADPGPRNPVLVMRAAWPLIDDLAGDQGLGTLIDARPELVTYVPVGGRMPDVDRPGDLGRLDQAPS
jgi:molybdenum cofactor cytidylyltransferase